MVAAFTASRHSWVGQETSWKNLNNLNWFGMFTWFRQHAAKLQGKAYIFVDYDKISSFPNTTVRSECPMCKHWIRTRWYRGWRGVISLQLNLNSATKTPYRMLVSSNWTDRASDGDFFFEGLGWSSSIRDCVFDTMTHENTWRDGIRYFMTTNLNACDTLQNQGRDYQNIEILCWMFCD